MWALGTSVTHLFNPKCSFLVITFVDRVALKIDTIKLKIFSKNSLLTSRFVMLKSSALCPELVAKVWELWIGVPGTWPGKVPLSLCAGSRVTEFVPLRSPLSSHLPEA